jgi:hypothetical protein
MSRIVIGYRSTLCPGLGLGLGVSALDRISKISNRKDRIERSTNNAINNHIARRQGRLF